MEAENSSDPDFLDGRRGGIAYSSSWILGVSYRCLIISNPGLHFESSFQEHRYLDIWIFGYLDRSAEPSAPAQPVSQIPQAKSVGEPGL